MIPSVVRVRLAREGNGREAWMVRQLAQIAVSQDQLETFPRNVGLQGFKGRRHAGAGELDAGDVETGGGGAAVAVEGRSAEREL